MRARFALCGLGLCLFGAGCSLVENTSRIAAHGLRQSLDDCQERRRNRQWAEEAWDRLRKTTPDCPYSEDLADGFKDGFADFLYRGGDGEPPALPPIKYRALRYQTPQGYQAVEAWFTGFRDGAAQARQGGYRQWITGPSSLRSTTPVPQPAANEEGSSALRQPTEEKQPPAPARRNEERPTIAAVAPTGPAASAQVQAQVGRQLNAWQVVSNNNEERPTIAAVAPTGPAASAQVQAQFSRQLNAWQVVSNNPDGSGVHTTWMNSLSFSELMQKVRHEKEENRAVGGRHDITLDGGSDAEALEVDDATYENLTAFLMWYDESPGE